MSVILVVLSIMIFLVILISFYFSNTVIKPKTFSVQETFDYAVKVGEITPKEFEDMVKEEVYIDSPYGYKLFGLFFPVEGSKKAVIICHGITWTLFGSLKYKNLFTKRGYNVFIYDHRNHGRSGGKLTSFGFFEKHDLKACTDWLYKRLGSGCKVGIMGESLGGATVLQNTAIDDRVAFCIADCPYSDLAKLLAYRLKVEYHIPGFPFLQLSSCITKLRIGMYYKDVMPVRDIENVKTPIFFAHGQMDEYIPKEMSIDMYNRKKGIKKLYLAPNAGHGQAYWKNREEYDRLVGEFLEEIES